MHLHGVKLAMVMLILSTAVHALPSDREKVINFYADSADISQVKHKGYYRGHVELIQGTTNLQAAYAETRGNEKNELVLAIAKGDKQNQAHYWTMTDPEKSLLHAYADTIYYYPLRHKIILKGYAKIIQGPNSFSAAEIKYDTLKQHVLSESKGTTRTTIIIYPEKTSS